MSTTTTMSQPATSSPLKRLIVRHPLIAFFIIAFAGSWIGFLPAILTQNGLGLCTLPTSNAPLNHRFLLGKPSRRSAESRTVELPLLLAKSSSLFVQWQRTGEPEAATLSWRTRFWLFARKGLLRGLV